MARKDARVLRDEAAAAVNRGKFRRAAECFLELEQLESRDASWPKRAAEMYRRLGRNREAIAAYERAVEKYAQGGFLVQAIAVCKLILQIDPQHSETLRRLSRMTEQRVTGTHSIVAPMDAIPELSVVRNTGPIPMVDPASLRAADMLNLPEPRAPLDDAPAPTATHAAGSAPVRASMPRVGFTGAPAAGGNGAAASSTSRIPPPPIPPPPPDEPYAPPVRGRVTTNPITLAPGAALDQVSLSEVMVGAEIERRGDGLSSGVILIPLDDFADDTSPFEIEAVTVPDEHDTVDVSIEAVESAGDEPSFEEIAVEDLPDAEDGDSYGFLPVPRSLSAAARRALAATPLLAGLGSDALAVMVARLDLVHLKPGEVLFREGDPGDTLYVVSEGEVAVMAEGPPRKELSRLLPGAFFGEVALIADQPRSASIVAVAATELLAIDRAVIAELVSQHPDVLRVILRFIKNRLVERVIQTSPLFEPFPERERRALADRFDFLEIEPDTGLIGQGTRPDGLYVLLAGRAEVLHTDHGGGRPRSLGFLGPGEVFGEAALWGSEASLATVQTRGKVLALRMPSGTFREVVMTHPQVMEYVGELAELRRVAIESPRSVVDRKLDLL